MGRRPDFVTWCCGRDLPSNEPIYELCLTGVTGREPHGMIGRGVSNDSITAMYEITTSQGLPESGREVRETRELVMLTLWLLVERRNTRWMNASVVEICL